jgi:hypothetical protein
MGRRLDRTVSGGAFPRLAEYWLAAPPERSALFFPCFSAISLAIQKALRERIPVVYFANTAQFAITRTAYPVLIYQASRPYRARTKTDFTYDVLNQRMMASFFRIVKPNLGAVLSTVVDRLRSEARDELVRPYQPHRVLEVIASVQKRSASTKLLYDLLVGESVLVNELLRMGGFGKKLPREQTKIATTLFRNWDYHLRRLCTGHDFRWLGPELFEIATNALIEQQQSSREPRQSPHAADGDETGLLNEPDFAESLSGLGVIEVPHGSLLMAADERNSVGRIHELECLPE